MKLLLIITDASIIDTNTVKDIDVVLKAYGAKASKIIQIDEKDLAEINHPQNEDNTLKEMCKKIKRKLHTQNCINVPVKIQAVCLLSNYVTCQEIKEAVNYINDINTNPEKWEIVKTYGLCIELFREFYSLYDSITN